MNDTIQIGTPVRLKESTVVGAIPSDKEDNLTAKVDKFLPDVEGGLLLDRDLRGQRYWNIKDVEPANEDVTQGDEASSGPEKALKDEDIRKSITGLFDGLLAIKKKDELHALTALGKMDTLTKAAEWASTHDYGAFHCLGLGWLDDLKRGICTTVSQNDNAVTLLANYDFFESHFGFWIEKIEGHACSADKSGTIMNYLVRHFAEGKPIVFDYTQKYVYHLPQKVFKDQDAILAAFKAFNGLLYGNPTEFFKLSVALTKEMAQ